MYAYSELPNIWQCKLEEILLNDEKFIEELDGFPRLLQGFKCKGKTIEEIKDYLHHNIIGNEGRTYILNVLAIKSLFRLIKDESMAFLDFNEQKDLEEFLRANGKHYSDIFNSFKLDYTVNLVKTLLANDENFINVFEKVFCKKGSVNKDNIVKIVISIMTCSPSYEFAVTYFIFKYITNNLEQCADDFKDEKDFQTIIKNIEKELGKC